MRQTQGLVLIDTGGSSHLLEPRVLASASEHDEAWLRDLLFAHPSILPLKELDPRAGRPVGLCTEMRCGVGRIDCLFCDENGLLTLVECKLWRNPDARRRVVAQILDYAAELRDWSYADLEREVNARHGMARSLYDRVSSSILDEAAFHDAIARNLREGRFTLLVAGDGIREEVEKLADFLTRDVSLRFHLALVEVRPYHIPGGGLVVAATPVMRTRIVERTVIVPATTGAATPDRNDESDPDEQSDRQVRDAAFWGPLLQSLRLDDPEQEVPRKGQIENKRFRLPAGAWLTAFRYRPHNNIGVAFVLPGDERRATIAERLQPEGPTIIAEIATAGTKWQPDRTWLCETALHFDDVHDEASWDAQSEFFTRVINAYVNAFRPRMAKIAREISP